MAGTSPADVLALADAVEQARAAVEEELLGRPDDGPGSLALAQMDLRVARNALRLAAAYMDTYLGQVASVPHALFRAEIRRAAR